MCGDPVSFWRALSSQETWPLLKIRFTLMFLEEAALCSNCWFTWHDIHHCSVVEDVRCLFSVEGLILNSFHVRKLTHSTRPQLYCRSCLYSFVFLFIWRSLFEHKVHRCSYSLWIFPSGQYRRRLDTANIFASEPASPLKSACHPRHCRLLSVNFITGVSEIRQTL